MQRSYYVRAAYDFSNPEPGEIHLDVGDVIEVTGEINDNWSVGRNLSRSNNVGNFPKNFVLPVEVPSIGQGQKVFLAVQSFHGEVADDLSFHKGELIIGLSSVDPQWWRGTLRDRTGIFPLTFVTELISHSTQDTPVTHKNSGSEQTQQNCTDERSANTELRTENSQVLARGKAIMDVEAQLDDELSFKTNDIIEIFHRIDDVFAMGRRDSEVGQFPLEFVEIFEGSLELPKEKSDAVNDSGKVKPKFDWWKDPNAEEEILRKRSSLERKATPSFEEQTAPIVLEEEYSLNTSHAFYSKPESVSEQCIEDVTGLESCLDGGQLSHTSGKTTCSVRTLFKFTAENDNELGFDAGEIVAVIGKVDEQWMEGCLGGKRGIFPTSYVELLKDFDIHGLCSDAINQPLHDDDKLQSSHSEVNEDYNMRVTQLPDVVSPVREMDDSESESKLAVNSMTGNSPADAVLQTQVSLQLDGHSDVVQTVLTDQENKISNVTLVEALEMSENITSSEKVETDKELDCDVSNPVVLEILEVKSEEISAVEMESPVADLCSHSVVPEVCAEESPSEKAPVVPFWNSVVSELQKLQKPASPKRTETTSESTKSEESGVNPEVVEVVKLKKSPERKEPCKEFEFELNSAIVKQNSKLITTAEPISAENKTDLNEVGNVKNADQERKFEKPQIKPKPKLKPKPDSAVLGSELAGVTTAVPKKTGFKKGVSFCLDDVIVYPRDADDDELQNSKKSRDGTSHNTHSVRSKSLSQQQSLDFVFGVCKLDETPETADLNKTEAEHDSVGMTSPTVTSPTVNCYVSDDITVVHFRSDKRPSIPLKPVNADTSPKRKPPSDKETKKDEAKETKKDETGLKIGQSLFYGSSTDTSVAPSLSPERPKKLPSRPARPKQNPAQGNIILPNGIFYTSEFEDSRPKPLPCRPAPPRPAPALNGASTIREENGGTGFENLDVIKDIERRITEIEKDLENLRREESTLTSQLSDSACEEERDGVQDKLEFCQANAVGLTEELTQLKENLLHLKQASGPSSSGKVKMERPKAMKKRQEENRKRRQETRTKVINEVMQSEDEYLRSLMLCLDTFFNVPELKCPPSVDQETLFGNIYDVVELSQKFINLLEANTLGKPFEDQLVGICFEDLQEELKRVYAVYCRNHDGVITLLEKFETMPEVQEYFADLVNRMRAHATVFDIGSILIKPVQRILKYPLLLEELLKTTDEDHSDYCHLLAAVRAMREVAMYINEFKRRKDLVLKYKKPTDTSLRDMFSRLTVHSYRKKLGRLSMMVTGTLTVDENFTREEVKFNVLNESVVILLQNINQYLECLQKSLAALETVAIDVSDYYGASRAEHEIDNLGRVYSCLTSTHLAHFRNGVLSEILPPLNSLVSMLQGPQKLIRKRYHKLLDYENAKLKQRSIRDAEQLKLINEEIRCSKNNYEALNLQLLEDLPKFYQISVSVIVDCLRQFFLLQEGYFGAARVEISKLMKLKWISETNARIIETFNIAHTEVVDCLSDMTFIPKSFNPLVDEKRKQKETTLTSKKDSCTDQADRQRAVLSHTFPSNKIFVVNEDFEGTLVMDLKLNRGALVGVIKESDPMGNRDRFLVTDGSSRGFVPKRLLVPYSDAPSDGIRSPSAASGLLLSPSSPCSSSSSVISDFPTPTNEGSFELSDDAMTSRGSFDDSQLSLSVDDPEIDPKEKPTAAIEESTMLPSHGALHRAEYVYNAEGEIEVSLYEGELVQVLQKQDMEGNTEWWLVERKNGQKGYVPASYLSDAILQDF